MGTLTIRVPDATHARLKQLARAKKVSVNKLIEALSAAALAEFDAAPWSTTAFTTNPDAPAGGCFRRQRRVDCACALAGPSAHPSPRTLGNSARCGGEASYLDSGGDRDVHLSRAQCQPGRRVGVEGFHLQARNVASALAAGAPRQQSRNDGVRVKDHPHRAGRAARGRAEA